MSGIIQRTVAILGTLLALASATLPALAAPVTLSGQVTYHERIALPADAVLGVRLVDLSRPGARVSVHAEAVLHNPGKVPLDFALRFDDGAILPNHHYALVAEISAQQHVVFRNTMPFPTDPLKPQGPIVIVVNFIGKLANAPAKAAVVPAAPSILETRWRVADLAGKPLDGVGHATLTIGSDMRAGGKGGCNNYFAQAQMNGPDLAFSAVAATRMACSDAVMADENAYFAALATVRSYLIDGTALTLLDQDGHAAIGLVRDDK
ncbi:MAG: Lipoprotein-related protein [Hyphomicrobiales bacterium]|nr:Lipoprotein-related protein [Hyphomicrobiales bacterium]